MKISEAIKIKINDKVQKHKSNKILHVIDAIVTPASKTTNHMTCVDIQCDDYQWYGYKQLKKL